MKLKTACRLVLIASAVVVAVAQEAACPQASTKQRFRRIDRNGDSFVAIEEARAFFARESTQRPATERPAESVGGQLNVVDAVFELQAYLA